MTADEGANVPTAAGKDRRGKLIFLALLVLGAGWVIYNQFTRTQLKDWQRDLPAALEQAAKENRQVVVVVYDSLTDEDFKRVEYILTKEANRKAMDAMQAIRVITRLRRDDPLAKKYGVTEYPTTLLLSPRGERITIWVGLIGEVEFRYEFLKGRPQQLP